MDVPIHPVWCGFSCFVMTYQLQFVSRKTIDGSSDGVSTDGDDTVWCLGEYIQ